MLATTIPAGARSPDRVASPGLRQTWTIQLTGAGDALVRVLVVLRRRRCQIVSVDYSCGDRHRSGQLVVSVVPPPAHAHCVASWIAALVEVEAVDRVGG